MKIESHLENLKESIREINEAIKIGLVKKQRTVGFHASAACIDMLEIYFHKNNLITQGMLLKHDWFLSKNKIHDKLFFDFQNKEKVLRLIYIIEEKRNALCYGKRQDEQIISEVIEKFNELKQVFIGLGLTELEGLE